MNFPHIIYGGDYNPDQWTPDIWEEDARLMQEAGVNLVSLGIFSWVKMEPQPGVFDFAWLDQIIDLLYTHGVSVNLATPTASPPAWMVKLHPEILPVTADGVTLWHGSRRHYCPHNPDYRNYAKRIAAQLAERYKGHPALAMWHVDNEYGCHIGECFCDNSAAAFRTWLKENYGTLDALNNAWDTAFWSQTYMDWEEIHPPKRSPAQVNPTQQVDWARIRVWFDNIIQQGIPFDLIGASYYPYWHGTLAGLQNNLNDVAHRYNKDILLVETAYAFTAEDKDNFENVNISPEQTSYPLTPDGQVKMLADIMDVIRNIPNGRGLGVMWWDAAWIAVEGNGWDPTRPEAGNNWENQALFDFDGRALPAMSLFNKP